MYTYVFPQVILQLNALNFIMFSLLFSIINYGCCNTESIGKVFAKDLSPSSAASSTLLSGEKVNFNWTLILFN